MTVRVSCPFCNTGLTLPGAPPTGRVQCPRCGESFPVKPPGEETAPGDPVEPGPPPSTNGTPAGHARPPSPRAFGAPAFIAAWLAALVLGVVLYTVLRRENGGRPPTPPDTRANKPAVTVPPAAVPGLAYLPADTAVAFAAQPGAIAPYAERTQTDPRQLLAAAGVPEPVFAALDKTGVKLDQIDHVAGGLVTAADSAIPRAVVVLALRQPLADEGAFRQALGATRFTAPSGATRDRVTVGGLPAEMLRIDPTTYLFGTDGRDLESATKAGGRGPAHLSAGLRESMARLSPASVAWVATDARDWAANPSVQLLAQVRTADWPQRLAGVRAAAAGVSLEPDPRLTLAVRAADAQAVKKLTDGLAKALAGRQSVIGSTDDWATAELPFDPKTGAAGLAEALPK